MKKSIFILATAFSLFSCSESNDVLQNVEPTVETSETSMAKASGNYDFWAGKDFNNDGNPFYSYTSSGQDFYQWTDYIASSGLVTAYCQNISNSKSVPEGWLKYKAKKPTSTFRYLSFEAECYKPYHNDCLPFPKVKQYINTPVEKITKLISYVSVNVPEINHNAGYPTGVIPSTNNVRCFNSSFDIYFKKPGVQVGSSYCAFMVWVNWNGTFGPGGDNLLGKNSDGSWQTVIIDNVEYYVVGRKNFLSYDYTLNFLRKDRTTVPGYVNVLAIINHAINRSYMADLGFNLRGTTLSDYNFGFEIFRANGAGNNYFKLYAFDTQFSRTY